MTTQREFWNDIGRTSQDGETSGGLLGMPTRAMSHRSERGMRLSKTPQEISDGVGSISSVAASPASLFQWRDVARGTVMSGGSGPLFAKWYQSSDRDGYWLKMFQGYCQRTLDDSLEEYSQTWPSSGLMQSGKCYRQQPLVRRISAKESSLLHGKDLLPTPYGLSANQGQGDGEFGKAIRMLPTPNATDWKGASTRSEGKERPASNDDLPTRLQRLFPTPTATPNGSSQGREGQPKRPSINSMVGGLLNPQFVEAMMGLPIGWTDLED